MHTTHYDNLTLEMVKISMHISYTRTIIFTSQLERYAYKFRHTFEYA